MTAFALSFLAAFAVIFAGLAYACATAPMAEEHPAHGFRLTEPVEVWHARRRKVRWKVLALVVAVLIGAHVVEHAGRHTAAVLVGMALALAFVEVRAYAKR